MALILFFEDILNGWQTVEPLHQVFAWFAVFDAARQFVAARSGQARDFSITCAHIFLAATATNARRPTLGRGWRAGLPLLMAATIYQYYTLCQGKKCWLFGRQRTVARHGAGRFAQGRSVSHPGPLPGERERRGPTVANPGALELWEEWEL